MSITFLALTTANSFKFLVAFSLISNVDKSVIAFASSCSSANFLADVTSAAFSIVSVSHSSITFEAFLGSRMFIHCSLLTFTISSL